MVSWSSSGSAGGLPVFCPIRWTSPLICAPRIVAGLCVGPSSPSSCVILQHSFVKTSAQLIPVLFCNAQEHLISSRQNPWPGKWATRPGSCWWVLWRWLPVLRMAALSQCEQPWHPPYPSKLHKPLRLTTLPSLAHAPYPPLWLPSALEHTALLWLLLFIVSTDKSRTKHHIFLFRGCFVMFFWFCFPAFHSIVRG